MEWKTMEVKNSDLEFSKCYRVSVLVNDNDEVVFVKLNGPFRKYHIGGYSGFTIGYGIMNSKLELPDGLDKEKFPNGSYVGYSSYSFSPMTSDAEETKYRNERYVAYDDTGKIIHSQDFFFGNCDHVTEMGEAEIYNMDILKLLIGKKFEDVNFYAHCGLFWSDADYFKAREGKMSDRSK